MNAFARAARSPLFARQLRKKYLVDDSRLNVQLFGLDFSNPVGLAAGFDKHGNWFQQLACLGFGCIEIGTVTGQQQDGNPKPRMFRLEQDRALINRMGFNSPGCEAVAESLRNVSLTELDVILGINIGKSKVVPLDQAPQEYQKTFEKLFPFGHYFTVNVSSPNTPGLRELQGKDQLIEILRAVSDSNQKLAQQHNVSAKPLLLKIAPDLTDGQLQDVVDVAKQFNLSGLIATNTTISREQLRTSKSRIESIGAGGLSGAPLKERSLEVVRFLRARLNGEIPIIGVGGISGGEDAWQMVLAGANLIQLYTGFVYGGPGIVRDINQHLVKRLNERKLNSISEAVGLNPSES